MDALVPHTPTAQQGAPERQAERQAADARRPNQQGQHLGQPLAPQAAVPQDGSGAEYRTQRKGHVQGGEQSHIATVEVADQNRQDNQIGADKADPDRHHQQLQGAQDR